MPFLTGCGKQTINSEQTTGGKADSQTREMVAARAYHKSILLSDGRVLLWGGSEKESWEIYNPQTRMFSQLTDGTPAAAVDPRGKVIVAGKYEADPKADNPDLAELLVVNKKLIVPRHLYAAVRLKDGRILVAGGRLYEKNVDGVKQIVADAESGANYRYVNSAEIYDPVKQTSRAAGDMNEIRSDDCAVSLKDGEVLFIGGFKGAEPPWDMSETSEIFDPKTGKFKKGPTMLQPRHNFAAARLSDGSVLVIGGFTRGSSSSILRSIEKYSPGDSSFKQVGELPIGLVGDSATVLPDDRVLVAGGMYGAADGTFDYRKDTEIFDPVKKSLQPCAGLKIRRAYHNAILLHDGTVLLSGGKGQKDKPDNLPDVQCRLDLTSAEEVKIQ